MLLGSTCTQLGSEVLELGLVIPHTVDTSLRLLRGCFQYSVLLVVLAKVGLSFLLFPTMRVSDFDPTRSVALLFVVCLRKILFGAIFLHISLLGNEWKGGGTIFIYLEGRCRCNHLMLPSGWSSLWGVRSFWWLKTGALVEKKTISDQYFHYFFCYHLQGIRIWADNSLFQPFHWGHSLPSLVSPLMNHILLLSKASYF